MKYFLSTIFIIFITVPTITLAAEIDFAMQNNQEKKLHEQFFVDVLIDPLQQDINGVEGVVQYDRTTLSLLRVEDGGTIINLWVNRPKDTEQGVLFAGIITNGFSGVIDPFESDKRMSGKLFRMVFESIRPGIAPISTTNTNTTRNDGKGTLDSVKENEVTITITKTIAQELYKSIDTELPTLSAQRIRNPLLYDNKFTLVFLAQDSGSGIARVEVQEGYNEWRTIESPYLLEDQQMHSILKVRAVDNNGNTQLVVVSDGSYLSIQLLLIIFSLIIFIIVLYWRKYYAKKI